MAAAVSDAEEGQQAKIAHVVSVGPAGSIRCTSPPLRSPRQQQQQQRQTPKAACPYHDHETITVSLVRKAGLYNPPGKSLSPQRSQRGSQVRQRDASIDAPGCPDEAYARFVAVGSSVGQQQHGSGHSCVKHKHEGHQHGSGQPLGKQERQQGAATLDRCPEPAAASSGSRKCALAQLRMARRRQCQATAADVEQQVAARMIARDKTGGSPWSSRKVHKGQHVWLNDNGEDSPYSSHEHCP